MKRVRLWRNVSRWVLLGTLAAGFIVPAMVWADRGPDPSGANTGTAIDVPAATAGAPNIVEVANAVGHNKVAINMIWTLITGFLVMFMQAGFAMVETGLTRAKNVAHTMAMNFMIYPLGMLGFYICGFAFMFGGLGAIGTMGGYAGLNHEMTINLFGKSFGLFGTQGFFLSGQYDVAVLRSSSFRWCSWIRRRRSPPAPWRSDGSTSPSLSTAGSWGRSFTRSMATGSGVAGGWLC